MYVSYWPASWTSKQTWFQLWFNGCDLWHQTSWKIQLRYFDAIITSNLICLYSYGFDFCDKIVDKTRIIEIRRIWKFGNNADEFSVGAVRSGLNCWKHLALPVKHSTPKIVMPNQYYEFIWWYLHSTLLKMYKAYENS